MKNIEKTEFKNCDLCGRVHPGHFLIDLGNGKCSCRICACSSMEYLMEEDSAADDLTDDQVLAANLFAPMYNENPLLMNDYDDYLNICCTMAMYILTDAKYTDKMALFESVCSELDKDKWERRRNAYLPGIYLSYEDRMDLIVGAKNPIGALEIFTLIAPKFEDVLPMVDQMADDISLLPNGFRELVLGTSNTDFS